MTTKRLLTMNNALTDPKEQLQALSAYQKEMEDFLKHLTGLDVSVSLSVHSAGNSAADLINLLDASKSLPNFDQVSSSDRTWITHTDMSKDITIFMPEGFDTTKPEDDEGYNQAVEYANAKRDEGQLKHNDDEIPF